MPSICLYCMIECLSCYIVKRGKTTVPVCTLLKLASSEGLFIQRGFSCSFLKFNEKSLTLLGKKSRHFGRISNATPQDSCRQQKLKTTIAKRTTSFSNSRLLIKCSEANFSELDDDSQEDHVFFSIVFSYLKEICNCYLQRTLIFRMTLTNLDPQPFPYSLFFYSVTCA